MKKIIVMSFLAVCLTMIFMTGCGKKNNDATQANPTTGASAEPAIRTDEPDSMDDGASGGAIDDIGDGIKDGVEDVGDGIRDAVDDADGNNGGNNTKNK